MSTQENLNKFKIGECHNVGNCSHVGERQAIPSDVANSGGFKCKFCGAPLFEVKKPKSFLEKYGKFILMIVVAIVVILLLLLGLKQCKSNNTETDTKAVDTDTEKTIEEPQKAVLKSVVPGELTLEEGKTAKLETVVENPNGVEVKIAWSSNNTSVASVDTDGNVTGIKQGEAVIIVTLGDMSIPIRVNVTAAPQSEAPAANTSPESKKKVNDGGNTGVGNGRGTLDLGYATYSGDIRNGKPEGAGLMTYKSSRKAGRDFSTDEAVYAEKGDRVDGVWTNGFLSTGTLYKKDGNVIKIRY